MCHILFLHQTTTSNKRVSWNSSLCHILFLHQTTIGTSLKTVDYCCVISHFYIKPQLKSQSFHILYCCVISYFYIKPQHESNIFLHARVVSYLISTSNHNNTALANCVIVLCHILFLHQTTTVPVELWNCYLLCHILFLHQTTTLLESTTYL